MTHVHRMQNSINHQWMKINRLKIIKMINSATINETQKNEKTQKKSLITLIDEKIH